MSLIDCGCGPGNITLDLAEVVAPGHVTGVDLDVGRLEVAQRALKTRGLDNVTFEHADIRHLPFPDNTFDAAFEHAAFEHLPDPVEGAREVFRVLKPGGVFGARDLDSDGALVAGRTEATNLLPTLVKRWNQHHGSNLRLGKELTGVLRAAGFSEVVGSASYDSNGTPEAVKRWAETLAKYGEDPAFASVVVEQGWATEAQLVESVAAWRAWADRPDAFYAQARGEAVGIK